MKAYQLTLKKSVVLLHGGEVISKRKKFPILVVVEGEKEVAFEKKGGEVPRKKKGP